MPRPQMARPRVNTTASRMKNPIVLLGSAISQSAHGVSRRSGSLAARHTHSLASGQTLNSLLQLFANTLLPTQLAGQLRELRTKVSMPLVAMHALLDLPQGAVYSSQIRRQSRQFGRRTDAACLDGQQRPQPYLRRSKLIRRLRLLHTGL